MSIMRDYAAQDPRSASAYLRGRGDGRVESFDGVKTLAPLFAPLLSVSDVERIHSKMLAGKAGPLHRFVARNITVLIAAVLVAVLVRLLA